jgi:hypothetical protein
LYYSDDVDLEEDEEENNSDQSDSQEKRSWLFDERKKTGDTDL